MKKYNNNPNRTYEQYVKHQMIKTTDPNRRKKWVEGGGEWEEKLNGFREIFNQYDEILSSCKNALCLGARTGQEVVALQERGIDAIGIDLVPCKPYVIVGDIHDLKYEDASYDFMYTNIFDHCFYPEKFCQEITRVLKPGGHILMNLPIVNKWDTYTETILESSEDIISLIEDMEVIKNTAIQQNAHAMNWELLFRRKEITNKL
jgi:SAM-dependent methyltransferase